jgi:hypothetical protein
MASFIALVLVILLFAAAPAAWTLWRKMMALKTFEPLPKDGKPVVSIELENGGVIKVEFSSGSTWLCSSGRLPQWQWVWWPGLHLEGRV